MGRMDRAWAACTISIATLVLSLIRCGGGGQGTWGKTTWGASLYLHTMQKAQIRAVSGRLVRLGVHEA